MTCCSCESITADWLYKVGFHTPCGGGFKKGILFLWRDCCGRFNVKVSGVDTVFTCKSQVENQCAALGIELGC